MRMRTLLALLAMGLTATDALADADSVAAVVKTMPGVVSSQQDNAGNLFVMVNNAPGIDWTRYSAGICKVVIQHHARIFLVKMIDANTVRPRSKPRDWGMLGGANCSVVQ